MLQWLPHFLPVAAFNTDTELYALRWSYIFTHVGAIRIQGIVIVVVDVLVGIVFFSFKLSCFEKQYLQCVLKKLIESAAYIAVVGDFIGITR